MMFQIWICAGLLFHLSIINFFDFQWEKGSRLSSRRPETGIAITRPTEKNCDCSTHQRTFVCLKLLLSEVFRFIIDEGIGFIFCIAKNIFVNDMEYFPGKRIIWHFC